MTSRFARLPRLFARMDQNGLSSFLVRAGLVALLFKPWLIKFVPSVVPMADIDPSIVEYGRSVGVDLLNPNAWPTVSGVLGRTAIVYLSLSLVWWGVSRCRRWIAARTGAGLGAATLSVGTMVAAYLVCYEIAQRTQWLGLFQAWETLDAGLPVWGGWLSGLPMADFGSDSLSTLWCVMACMVEAGYVLLDGRLAWQEAQDGALRARLAPHFLFNALNTLHAQIEEDPATAQATTERLAGIFRQVLEVSEHPTVSLARELAFVEDYLGIERARLGARLHVEVDVPDQLTGAHLPVLGLQVLVENAIKHGVEPRIQGGTVRIEARKEGKWLRVSVTDPGDGTSRGSHGTGHALSNLRARLARPRDLILTQVPEGFRASFSFPQSA